MVKFYSIEQFLQEPGVILDVRSPGEYASGHLPQAINLPLFTDEERAMIGSTYTYYGQTEAIDLGLQYMGRKLADYVATARELLNGRQANVYCWRGGMRSTFASTVLDTMMLPSSALIDGYKAFRSWSLQQLQEPRKIIILGGLTGSGKTDILKALASAGEQVLDLEQLANHKGSVFGGFSETPQPKNENFENSIAILWHGFDPSKPVWIEDESRLIGSCKIPDTIFKSMISSPTITIERPRAERLKHIAYHYESIDNTLLSEAALLLKKRLGGKLAQQAADLFMKDRFTEACDIVINYYDKSYSHSLNKRTSPKVSLSHEGLASAEWAEKLIAFNKEALLA